MRHRRKRPTPFAWLSAALFWALLVLAPLLAARIVSDTFSQHGLNFDVTPASLAATRNVIDQRFDSLMVGQQSRKETWSRLVGEQVASGNIRTARGLMLAAPSMLDAQNAASLLASAEVQELTGEDAIEQAALNYLTEDVRYAYEHSVSPLRALWKAAIADTAEGMTDPPNTPESELESELESENDPNEFVPAELNILGDERDLALQAGRWVRGQSIDTFTFALSGIGLSVLDDSERTGASIIRAADKAKKLNPDFKRNIQRRLFNTAPPERLQRDLTVRFSGALAIAAQGTVVLDIIRSDINTRELEGLKSQLRLIRDISQKTSASATIRILSYVRNDLDLQRVRLLTEAGGDKALALMSMEGGVALTAAQTPVRWTSELRLGLSLLFGMGLTLVWLAADTLFRSLRRGRPVRRSAVYGLDGRDWDQEERRP